MIPATKLKAKAYRCQGKWVVGVRTQCTQVAKYKIDGTYYCTTHAKIRALKEILVDE